MEKENFIEIENSPLYFKEIIVSEDNDSATLVFLHDALGSTEQWKDFPKLLSQKTGLNAVIFDRRGYGKSSAFEKRRTNYYMHEEAHLMLPEFLKKLEIEKPILFGHSDGGTIALLYASKFEPIAIICEAAHILVENETIEGIRKAIEQKFFLIGKLKKYHDDKTATLFDAWYKTWLSSDFRDWNIEDDLKSIKCPALIIQGENDEYATYKHLEKIEKGIGKNARSVLIKDCGHIPHLEAKEEIIEKTEKFIRTVL